jgi:hypothetical protein
MAGKALLAEVKEVEVKGKRLIQVLLGVVAVFLIYVQSVAALPASQPVDAKTIAGSPLRIEVGSNGSVQVYHQRFSHGATFGAADSGFFIAIGNDVYGPNLPGTNSSSASVATLTMSPAGHDGPTGSGSQADPFRIVTSHNLSGSGAQLALVQAVSYINGNNYFQLDWSLSNNGGSQTCLKAYHAADIYFADSDYGIGYYNAGTGSVGGFNERRDWFMVFTPVARADRYEEARYGLIWERIAGAADLANTVDNTYLDNGIALQWNLCLQPGENRTISDLWSFGESEAAVIPTVVAPPAGNVTPQPGGATPGPAGPVDVWAKDSPEDDGTLPSSRLNAAWWTSPDIIVRNRQDGERQHQNPVGGQNNYVYVQVRNRGSSAAENVRVVVYWANPALGLFWPTSWNELGATTVTVPAGGTAWTEAVAWSPARSGHLCLLVRLESAADPIRAEGDVPGDNNIAQRNVHVLGLPQQISGSSGGESVPLVVVGPPGPSPRPVDVVIQYPSQPSAVTVKVSLPPELMQRWQAAGGTVTGGQVAGNQLTATGTNEMVISGLPLTPGEEAELTMDLEGPTETPFVVAAVERVDGQDVGGSVYVYEGLVEESLGDRLGNSALLIAIAGCWCLFGILLLVLAFLFFFRRRPAAGYR